MLHSNIRLVIPNMVVLQKYNKHESRNADIYVPNCMFKFSIFKLFYPAVSTLSIPIKVVISDWARGILHPSRLNMSTFQVSMDKIKELICVVFLTIICWYSELGISISILMHLTNYSWLLVNAETNAMR